MAKPDLPHPPTRVLSSPSPASSPYAARSNGHSRFSCFHTLRAGSPTHLYHQGQLSCVAQAKCRGHSPEGRKDSSPTLLTSEPALPPDTGSEWAGAGRSLPQMKCWVRSPKHTFSPTPLATEVSGVSSAVLSAGAVRPTFPNAALVREREKVSSLACF